MSNTSLMPNNKLIKATTVTSSGTLPISNALDDFSQKSTEKVVEKFEHDYLARSSHLATQRDNFAHTHISDSDLSARLFNATAEVKILMSQVAMHVDQKWRDILFRQIDNLHNIDDWYEDDLPINKGSFSSFIKGMLSINPANHPDIGLTHEGYVIAVWAKNGTRLVTEFKPNDRVKWLVSRLVDDEVERAAGETSILRLLSCLAPYQPDFWFNGNNA